MVLKSQLKCQKKKSKSALLVTSVASMVKQFNMYNIKLLQNMGFKVVVASNFSEPGNIPIHESEELYKYLQKNNVKPIDVPIQRSPFNSQNVIAYKKLKMIINSDFFNLIHCQSPIGGFLTRVASVNARRKGTKLIYTAHGFHFYKGAPKINWMVYYPIEKKLSKMTDAIITINREDFERAKNFHSPSTFIIPGVGIDVDKFKNMNIDVVEKRRELNLPLTGFVITSVGELNDNKNHQVIIKALSKIKNKNIHYIICGEGYNKNKLKQLADQTGLGENLHLMGYRNDIPEILTVSNIFAFPSKREGLGLAAIEAMASGLPLLTSNIHGINDYSIEGSTGFKYDPNDIDGFAKGIIHLYEMPINEIKKIRTNNKLIAQDYHYYNSIQKMRDIYEKFS